MPPCRGHKKSKTGCVVCKSRRIKCDETHPQCMNCIRHGVPSLCVYKTPTLKNPIPELEQEMSDADEDSAFSVSSSSLLSTLSKPGESSSSKGNALIYRAMLCTACGRQHSTSRSIHLQPSSEFPGSLPACTLRLHIPPAMSMPTHALSSSVDLKLLYHFITVTAQTMTVSPIKKHVEDLFHAWSYIIGGKLTSDYPFVLHAVCAAAAAHINTEESLSLVEHHWNLAIQGVSTELTASGISDTNCEALFATTIACSFVLMSKASRRFQRRVMDLHDPETNEVFRRRDVLDTRLVSFARGTFTIAQRSTSTILFRPSGIILPSYPHTVATTRTLSRRTETMLGRLEKLCHDQSFSPVDELEDVHIATGYFIALWNLRRVWAILEECCSTTLSSIGDVDFEEEQQGTPGEMKRIRRPNFLSSSICHFIINTPAQFWNCLDKKRPRALIIYAYYVVAWDGLRFGHLSGWDQGPWWIDGRVDNDLEAVRRDLDILAENENGGHFRKEIGDEWMSGAWHALSGLRYGWWIDGDCTEGLSYEPQMITPGPSNHTRLPLYMDNHLDSAYNFSDLNV